tara:strand:+ start:110 stop:2017 length:1908 start_codon:yes stop_codon:yes gene_type:complete
MNIIELKISYLKKLKKIHRLPSKIRRLILVFLDLITISISILFSTLLTTPEQLVITSINFKALIFLSSFLGISIYILTGQYKSLTGYFREQLIYKFALRNICITILINFLTKSTSSDFAPINFLIFFWIVNTNLNIWIRLIIRDFILNTNKIYKSNSPKVIIYGAGMAGAQLASSIDISGIYEIKGFIDDNPSLWGRNLISKKIFPPKILDKLRNEIDQILIAIPSLSRSRKNFLINAISKYSIPILEIPSIEELALGKAQITTLRPIKFEDLLGRETIIQESKLIGNKIKNSVILVTGAGGSIGSELSRQILNFKPNKLIILENNELALYSIESELKEYFLGDTIIIPILGNATNQNLINNLFDEHNIQTIFHAAAYKHVPIVEANPIEGLINNVISSYVICKTSELHKPKNVVLISSDKAVRPTNIMGASKRLSELIFKSFSQKSQEICFSMVRFGNVLGSSGSVVPLFQKQIANGGPIKVTHPDIIRYFMTINEACGLVLETIELAKGGDIFLLDMGKPIKILDLAKQMISLSGLQLKDANNPNGDIEIISTGLRPGEKLFEELLIDGEAAKTINPLIFRDKEKTLIPSDLLIQIEKLINFLLNRDEKEALKLLKKLVPEWSNSNNKEIFKK